MAELGWMVIKDDAIDLPGGKRRARRRRRKPRDAIVRCPQVVFDRLERFGDHLGLNLAVVSHLFQQGQLIGQLLDRFDGVGRRHRRITRCHAATGSRSREQERRQEQFAFPARAGPGGGEGVAAEQNQDSQEDGTERAQE